MARVMKECGVEVNTLARYRPVSESRCGNYEPEPGAEVFVTKMDTKPISILVITRGFSGRTAGEEETT